MMDLMYRDVHIGIYEKDSIKITFRTMDALFYFGMSEEVKGKELQSFISDRIISSTRRDVDKFLNRLGLIEYDAHKIALATRLINPMDGFWLRQTEEETYDNFVVPKIIDLFKEDKLTHDNTISSGGNNIKYYSKFIDKLGIVKKRLMGLTYDTEAELAVYYLANMMGIYTCPVYRVDEDHTFSEFQYNFLNENIIHMRHALPNYNHSEDTYTQIVTAFPNTKDSIIRMLVLDFVTAQDDRHMSNYAIYKDTLYPLYDNGRSLFWDEKISDIKLNLTDVKLFSKSFGGVGTYYDVLETLSLEGVEFSKLMNLDIKYSDIAEAYRKAGFEEKERLNLISRWTDMCLEVVLKLDLDLKDRETKIKKSNIFGK